MAIKNRSSEPFNRLQFLKTMSIFNGIVGIEDHSLDELGLLFLVRAEGIG